MCIILGMSAVFLACSSKNESSQKKNTEASKVRWSIGDAEYHVTWRPEMMIFSCWSPDSVGLIIGSTKRPGHHFYFTCSTADSSADSIKFGVSYELYLENDSSGQYEGKRGMMYVDLWDNGMVCGNINDQDTSRLTWWTNKIHHGKGLVYVAPTIEELLEKMAPKKALELYKKSVVMLPDIFERKYGKKYALKKPILYTESR